MIPGVESTLAWPEVMLGAFVGDWRRVSALVRSRPATYAYNGENPWGQDIESACAEMALAKATNRYWYALASTRLRDLPGDVGRGVQVRSTARPNGALLIHPDDPDEHAFYLVVGRAPHYTIVGSILAGEAKQQRYWRTEGVRHPAFFVPQHALRSLWITGMEIL